MFKSCPNIIHIKSAFNVRLFGYLLLHYYTILIIYLFNYYVIIGIDIF